MNDERRGLRIAAVEQFLPEELSDKTLVEAVGAEHWRAETILGQLGFNQDELRLAVGDLSGGQQNRQWNDLVHHKLLA